MSRILRRVLKFYIAFAAGGQTGVSVMLLFDFVFQLYPAVWAKDRTVVTLKVGFQSRVLPKQLETEWTDKSYTQISVLSILNFNNL